MNEITSTEKVLFICHHNSGRSQLAEALLRMLYPDRYESYSAGVIPSQVNPYAIKVMEQLGVDMSSHRSKSIDEFKDTVFDYVVTVCDKARESCPYFPGHNIIHHSFTSALSEGSEEEIQASFIRVRDEIRDWLEKQFGALLIKLLPANENLS
ncbi:MAG: low molecular weight phosphatase family protein [Firmicutes bacterium HGW-Firmicutes-15]|nr:MAG: low molecular weight phosphatase family protein [Firmicutes bacterium HGW-Firmicutes-15]